MHLDLAGILAAGLLTFASPCVLPLVPVYLALLGGASVRELRGGTRSRLITRTLAFAAGLTTVFVLLGLAASGLGQILVVHRRQLLLVAGVVMVGFGLHTLGMLRLPFADRESRPWLHRLNPGGGSLPAAYSFGAAFALGWTPCIGPVLGSVLTYTASAAASPVRAAMYLATYAAGMSLPLLAAAAFAPLVLRGLDRLRPHLRAFEVATGALLVAVGVLVATDHLMTLTPASAGEVRTSTSMAADGPGASCSEPTDGPVACSVAAGAGGSVSSEVPTLDVPAVVEVMSHHCPVCREMVPVVAEAERDCDARVMRAFIEEPAGAALVMTHGIRGVPTFLVLDDRGAEVGRLVGAQSVASVRGALQRVSPRLCVASRAGAGVVPD